MSTNYEAPHCVTSSILLLLHPSLVHIFSLGNSMYVPHTSILITSYFSHLRQCINGFCVILITFISLNNINQLILLVETLFFVLGRNCGFECYFDKFRASKI
jgi:hypothetical protein